MADQPSVGYCGRHLLVELWGASRLDELAAVEQALTEAVAACGATLLKMALHRSSPNNGVSGVAVIAESHISIHTWPEYGYAAVDIFVCGSLDPYPAVPVLRRAFQPGKVQLMEVKRGIL